MKEYSRKMSQQRKSAMTETQPHSTLLHQQQGEEGEKHMHAEVAATTTTITDSVQDSNKHQQLQLTDIKEKEENPVNIHQENDHVDEIEHQEEEEERDGRPSPPTPPFPVEKEQGEDLEVEVKDEVYEKEDKKETDGEQVKLQVADGEEEIEVRLTEDEVKKGSEKVPNNEEEEQEQENEKDEEMEGPPPGCDTILPLPLPLQDEKQAKLQVKREDGEEEKEEEKEGNFKDEVTVVREIVHNEHEEQEVKDAEEVQEEELEGPPPGWDTLSHHPPPLPLQDGEQVILPVSEEQKDKKEDILKDKVKEDILNNAVKEERENLQEECKEQGVKKENEDEESEGPPPGWNTLPPPPPPPLPLEESGQMVCGSCRRLLSYPRGSKHVRCSCCQTVNYVLEEHQVGQVECASCAVLLMYPYGAQSVRCCSCSSVIYIGDYNKRPPLSVQQSRASRPFKIAH